MFETIITLYAVIEFLVILLNLFYILTDDEFMNPKEVLNNRYYFIKAVFSIQVCISTIVDKYNINLAGHVFLQLLIIIFAIPCNVFIFATLTMMLIGKVITKLFCLLFRKKETNKNDV